MADYDLMDETGGGLLGGGGGGWLGNLFNFSGGRSTTADLYGDLFSKKQLAAIQQRESQAKFKGLLDGLAQAAAPSKFKKNWGQMLGQIGSGLLGAEGGDKAATTALGGQLTAQKIAQLKQEAAASAQYQAAIRKIMEQWVAAGGAPGTMPPGAPPVPNPGVSPGAPPPGPSPNGPPPNPAGNGPPPGLGTFALPGGAPQPRPFGLPPSPPPGSQQTGLPLPPDQMQLAGLLGGGPPPPFPEEEGNLPPPDTVIPSLGGGGLLDPAAVRLASSGGGLPADLDWLNKNAPFPTLAKPQGDPIKWRHDTPAIDPNDPASQGPGSPAGRGAGALQDNRDVVIPAPGQRRIDPLIQAQMTRTQSGGAPSAGARGPLLPNMPVPPNLPGGGGANQPIPGIGISPQGLAILDLFAAGAGKGTPFKGLTDTYYKDPAYLEQAAGASARGTLPYDRFKTQESQATQYRYDLLKKMAEDGMTLDQQGNIVPLPVVGDIKAANAGKVAEVTEKWKSMFKPIPGGVDVHGPDGRIHKEQMTEYEFYRRQEDRAKRGTAAAPQPGDIAGTPQFSKFEEGLGANAIKDFGDRQAAARSAKTRIETNNQSLKLLDSGLYTGWDANLALGLARVFGVSGTTTAERVKNTQLFVTQRMQEAAQAVRDQPGAASDKDLIFNEKMSLGNITLDAETIREGLEILNRMSLNKIREFNEDADRIPADVTKGIRQTVKEPPVYDRSTWQTPGGNTITRPPGR